MSDYDTRHQDGHNEGKIAELIEAGRAAEEWVEHTRITYFRAKSQENVTLINLNQARAEPKGEPIELLNELDIVMAKTDKAWANMKEAKAELAKARYDLDMFRGV